MSIVGMIFVMVLATFSIRACSLLFFSGRTLSSLTMKALSMVPVSILCAICSPLIFRPNGDWANPILLIEFWSALGCIIVARYGLIPAIIVGMGIYATGKFYTF